MCLYIGNNKPQIAESDILCYKAVRIVKEDSMWTGPFRFLRRYKFNVPVEAERAERESYKPIGHLTLAGSCGDRIDEGFHAYTIYKEEYYPTEYYNEKLFTKHCIIPKGAEYCIGITHEIVSTHIIVFSDIFHYIVYKTFKPFFVLKWRMNNKNQTLFRKSDLKCLRK